MLIYRTGEKQSGWIAFGLTEFAVWSDAHEEGDPEVYELLVSLFIKKHLDSLSLIFTFKVYWPFLR